jgi:hypothetical protein
MRVCTCMSMVALRQLLSTWFFILGFLLSLEIANWQGCPSKELQASSRLHAANTGFWIQWALLGFLGIWTPCFTESDTSPMGVIGILHHLGKLSGNGDYMLNSEAIKNYIFFSSQLSDQPCRSTEALLEELCFCVL